MTPTALIEAHTIAGVVLAGGRASRLGGGDKPLLDLGGEPMLTGIIRRLRPQIGQLAINANGDPARLAGFDLPVIGDAVDGFQGPLAGILAGLEWARSHGAQRLLTAAGDTPFFPDDLCRSLLAASAADRIAVATSGGRPHPVFALWPVALAEVLSRHLSAGGSRKVVDFITGQSFAEAEFAPVTLPGGEVDPFFSINTPDDLAQARRLLQVTGT